MATSGSTYNQQVRDLLGALANFMRPIVQDCLSSDIIIDVHKKNQSPPVESVEHQLVDCFKAYIAMIVQDCRITESAVLSNPDLANVPSSTTVIHRKLEVIENTNRSQAVPAQVRQCFEDYGLKGIRRAVSSMPTRLLAFDSTGSQVRLVDHREAIQYLAEITFTDVANCSLNFAESQDDPLGCFLHGMPPGSTLNNKMDTLIEKHTQYSILSHTWTKMTSGEISYQDWATRAQNHSGYTKIINFCKVSAQNHGFRLGWVDTCCINKESSAELDEAIRSMYNWYRNAALCVVYLSETESLDEMIRDSWFTRGWTLQELVAPRRIAVYNMHWMALACDKNTVAAVAGIQTHEVMAFEYGFTQEIPISRRLQIACGRQLTREEDRAYSLMGILGVSIPIAYGEGAQRAFSRLMHELIDTNRGIMDIFNHGYCQENYSLIPSTVDVYKDRSDAFDFSSGGRMIYSTLRNEIPIEPFLLTHVGLRIHLLIVPGLKESYDAAPLTHQVKPIGDLYGQVWNYSLLHRELYSGKELSSENVLNFGIVNFSMADDNVIIQNPSLSIPLVGVYMNPGRMDTYTTYETWYSDQYTSPPILTLRSSEDPDGTRSFITVPEHKLMFHGLIRRTLYL